MSDIRDLVDNSDTCRDGSHYWPHDYQEGDTCNCGAFYVIKSRVDGLIIEATPDDPED